jgi:Zn-dependent M28 family amino/carboxypeptidase
MTRVFLRSAVFGQVVRPTATLLAVAFFILGCTKTQRPRGEPWKEFSGENALKHVQQLVEFGPRPPGSEVIEKSRAYITKQLQDFGWKVAPQTFTSDTPRGKVNFVNLVASFSSRAKEQSVFLLCSHYDTKVFDSIRFVGANDGGSSTGALIEMARVLALHPELAKRTLLVFFDGEEAYENFSDTDGLYGSRYFAAHLPVPKEEILGGILLDMVGDSSLTITLSPDSPAQMTSDIFDSAEALKLREHFTYLQNDIMDDHTPLNAAGVTTIDLIDFDFPPWHTADDTMDKISAESLRIVGAVTLYYLSNFAFK